MKRKVEFKLLSDIDLTMKTVIIVKYLEIS